jgi:hypothetical protein
MPICVSLFMFLLYVHLYSSIVISPCIPFPRRLRYYASGLNQVLRSFPALWPPLALYLVWALWIDKAPERGTRFSQTVRSWRMFQYFAEYYPASYVRSRLLSPFTRSTHRKLSEGPRQPLRECGYTDSVCTQTCDLPADRPYVFGYHPHGIIGTGAIATFATEGASSTITPLFVSLPSHPILTFLLHSYGLLARVPGDHASPAHAHVQLPAPVLPRVPALAGHMLRVQARVQLHPLPWARERDRDRRRWRGGESRGPPWYGGLDAEEAARIHQDSASARVRPGAGILAHICADADTRASADLVPVFSFGENDVRAAVLFPRGDGKADRERRSSRRCRTRRARLYTRFKSASSAFLASPSHSFMGAGCSTVGLSSFLHHLD